MEAYPILRATAYILIGVFVAIAGINIIISIKDDKGIKGLYMPNLGWLLIKMEGKTAGSIKHTIHHEVGHSLWDCLNESIKEQYEEIYNLDKCSYNLKRVIEVYDVGEYVEETFAEDFADWQFSRLLCKEKELFFWYKARC